MHPDYTQLPPIDTYPQLASQASEARLEHSAYIFAPDSAWYFNGEIHNS
ncbi:hypothetical protein GCM10010245_92300 [Streptomyces spectabilis]|nr:hypothetical protein GCM10010245_92300 [Streptomyces spectabilis]